MHAQQSSSKAIVINIIRTNGGNNDAVGSTVPPNLQFAYHLYIRTHDNNTNLPISNLRIASTLAHELGHALGLEHTHYAGRTVGVDNNADVEMKCFQESVSRTYTNPWLCASTKGDLSSSVNGDFLTDTEADPGLSANRVTAGCVLNLPTSGDYHEDNWGDDWTPDIRNVMSYSRRLCRDNFSDGQIGIMWYWLDKDFFMSRTNIANVSVNRPVCQNSTTPVLAPSISGATYNWETSDNLTVVSQTTNTANLRATNNNGSFGNLVANISTNYADFCVEKVVWVGKPNKPFDISLIPPDGVCKGFRNIYQFGVIQGSGAGIDSYYWDLQNPGNIMGNNTGMSIRLNYPLNTMNGNYSVAVKTVNTCGSSQYLIRYFNVKSCLGGGELPFLRTFPNPVKNSLYIEIDKDRIPERLKSKRIEMYLYDKMMSLKKKINFKGNSTILNVSNLQPDIYILKIIIGNEIFEEKVIVSEM